MESYEKFVISAIFMCEIIRPQKQVSEDRSPQGTCMFILNGRLESKHLVHEWTGP